jgi:hypothetical protein
MKKYISIAAMMLLAQFSMAQTTDDKTTDLQASAPTLQLGLDGISLGKGNLDAQLIMEIIAEKQREVKIKVVQNLLLNKLAGGGGIIYNYGDNVLRTVIEEKDAAVRTRKIMEATVNLVFVHMMAEYYLKYQDKLYTRGSPNLVNVNATTALRILAKAYLKDSVPVFNGLGEQKLLSEEAVWTRTVVTARQIAAEQKNVLSNKPAEDDVADPEADTYLRSLVLDIAAEVVRHNIRLKDLGLMQISYSRSYEFYNRYLNLTSAATKQAADAIYQDMQDHLITFTDHIGYIYYLATQLTYKNNGINIAKANLAKITTPLTGSPPDFKKAADSLGKIINLLAGHLTKDDTTYAAELKQLTEIAVYLKKAKLMIDGTTTTDGPSTTYADILYTLQADFIPALAKISYRSGALVNLIDELTITERQLSGLLNTILKDKLPEIQQWDKVEPMIQLVSRLYQFDQALTFSDYLKFISETENIFTDDKIKDGLSIINSFVKDYTVIRQNEKGKEVIDFNVESFLVKLSNMRHDRNSALSFLFTVGVNTGYFENALTYHGDNLSSFSFVSEKIGLKWKLYDRAYKMNHNSGEIFEGAFGTKYKRLAPPKEPLISNYHMIFYASGLLYNVVNLKTSGNFNAPLVGTGFGLTFFNALDMNITYAIPILDDRGFGASRLFPLISLNFDILFTEYLSRLGKKH